MCFLPTSAFTRWKLKNIKAVGCKAKQWALTHFYYYSCFQEFQICRSLEWITRCIGICIWKENNYQSKNQWLISGLKLKGRIWCKQQTRQCTSPGKILLLIINHFLVCRLLNSDLLLINIPLCVCGVCRLLVVSWMQMQMFGGEIHLTKCGLFIK